MPADVRPGLASGLGRAILRIDLFTPRWAYVGRSVLAAALALVLAYHLELETPYSAATTVLLVTSPVQGAVLAKGAWRIIGTLAGAVVAILLMSAFSQAPALFILGFGLWLGLCAAAATILRHFRSSGAAVAGYTIGLATYGSFTHPELTLDHVLGRTATVVLGVVCLGVVAALLAARGSARALDGRIAGTAAVAIDAIAARLRATDPAAGPAPAGLAGDILAIDTAVEMAAAESAEAGLRARQLRRGMASLFAAVAGAWSLPAGPAMAPLAAVRSLLADGLTQVAAALRAGNVDAAQAAMAAAHQTLSADQTKDTADTVRPVDIDRLAEVLDDLEAALAGFQGRRGTGDRRLRAPVDLRAAVDNGLRAFLAIVLAGAAWVATGWSDGSLMLLILAPYCVLAALAGNPVAVTGAFIEGTVAAVPAALICAFGLLPQVSGLPLLLAVMAPFWAAGLYATTHPPTAIAGLAYLVAFNTLVAAGNPTTFNLAATLNQAMALVVAVLVTLLAFQLLLPRNPGRLARRAAAAIRRDAFHTLRRPARDRLGWDHRQHHRLAGIGLALKGDPAQAGRLMAYGLAGLHFGRAALRIHMALAHGGMSPPARITATLGLEELWALRRQPGRAAAAARHTASHLETLAPDDPGNPVSVHALAASFQDLAALFDTFASAPEPTPC